MIGPGKKLGRYELREPIGAGGMSAVYRAYDPMLDRDVALKILPPELARDDMLRRRFEEEARSLGHVGHPNLVRIFTIGQEGPVSFYAMELIEGLTLEKVLGAKGRLAVEEALTVFHPFLRALDAIHQAGS